MQSVIRWGVIGVGFIHGLIHLLGVAKGFDLADVEQLEEPIGVAMGAAWLAATVVVLAATAMLGFGSSWWRSALLAAAVVSQLVIVTSWSDAKAGTAANVILLLAVAWPAALDR